MFLLLDNYDSFTYNLVHILRSMNVEYEVYRNDKIGPEEALSFDIIILSPGPGIPSEAGNMANIIAACAGKKHILGICLGHQAIAEYLGGKLNNMSRVYHGVKSKISIKINEGIFEGIPKKIEVGRYHSWEVAQEDLPENISITAEDEIGTIMALSSSSLKLYGIQFHPESVMTEYGDKMIRNFLKIAQLSKKL